MRKNLIAWAIIVCVGAAALVARAQAPSAPPKDAQKSQDAHDHPALRSTTRLVQINVVVRDNKTGNPVEGLKAEDFTVLDQGQPQKIAVFASEAGAVVPTAHGVAAPPPLPANVFTNRLDRSGQVPPNVTVLLFDALNTPIQDQTYARQQIIKFLKTLHPEDHAAIYLLTTKLTILQEFTQDTSQLLAALNNYKGVNSSFLDAATPNDLDPSSVGSDMGVSSGVQQLLNNADGALQDFANIDRAETTASALEAIAGHIAGIPGRKSIVWVSGSFPIEIGFSSDSLTPIARTQRSFTPELEHAAEVLNQASIAVYPVDARGLMVLSTFSASKRKGPVNQGAIASGGPDQNNFFTMNMLADRTGGKAFYNNNDITGAVRAAISDGQYSYVIGFYPNHGKWDGKFHELKVHVNVHGSQVRFRKGYFATPDAADPAKEAKEQVDAAAWSPIESTGLGIQVAVKTVEPASARTVELAVQLNTHELLLTQEQDGHWHGNLELVFLQLGRDGRVLTGETKTLSADFPDDRYKLLLEQGIVISRHLPILPDATHVRIIVRDGSSSEIGSVTVPLKAFLPQQAAIAAPTSPAKPRTEAR